VEDEPSQHSLGTDESVTAWLQAWTSGDPEAGERLFSLVYPELKKLARRFLARERAGVPLGATELVHETFLRLVAQRQDHWQNRDQFFALAATLARRVLVDQAKHGRRRKRGGGVVHVSFDEGLFPGEPPNVDLLALDDALVELARIRLTTARIVELRFFAGLDLVETARILGVSRATVLRQWRFARAWLARKLGGSR
jgi:RNA polymerase sigma factor (TIGR02999 family)